MQYVHTAFCHMPCSMKPCAQCVQQAQLKLALILQLYGTFLVLPLVMNKADVNIWACTHYNPGIAVPEDLGKQCSLVLKPYTASLSALQSLVMMMSSLTELVFFCCYYNYDHQYLLTCTNFIGRDDYVKNNQTQNSAFSV